MYQVIELKERGEGKIRGYFLKLKKSGKYLEVSQKGKEKNI